MEITMRQKRCLLHKIVVAGTTSLLIGMGASVSAQIPAEFTQSIIDDMQKPNDGIQIGYQRSHYAGAEMGLMARGDYTPTWWQPGDPALKSATWWTLRCRRPLWGPGLLRFRVLIQTASGLSRSALM